MGYGESLYQSYQSKIKLYETPELAVPAEATIAWDILSSVTPGKTVTLNGVVFTFVAADPVAPFEVLIGADEAESTDNLANAINAYEPLSSLVSASQDYDLDTLHIQSDLYGEVGNDYTLASDETTFTVVDFSGGVNGTTSAAVGDLYLSTGNGYVYICVDAPSDSSSGQFYRVIVEEDPR